MACNILTVLYHFVDTNDAEEENFLLKQFRPVAQVLEQMEAIHNILDPSTRPIDARLRMEARLRGLIHSWADAAMDLKDVLLWDSELERHYVEVIHIGVWAREQGI